MTAGLELSSAVDPEVLEGMYEALLHGQRFEVSYRCRNSESQFMRSTRWAGDARSGVSG